MSTAKRVIFSIELAIDSDSNGCIGGRIIHKTKLNWHPARIWPGVNDTEIKVLLLAVQLSLNPYSLLLVYICVVCNPISRNCRSVVVYSTT